MNKYFGKRISYPRDRLPTKLNNVDFFKVYFDISSGQALYFVALKNSKRFTMYFESFWTVPLLKEIKSANIGSDEIFYDIYRTQNFDSNWFRLLSIDFLEDIHDFGQ